MYERSLTIFFYLTFNLESAMLVMDIQQIVCIILVI